ncbi:Lrp/AsnC ligand binding domain-containing protein [Candidatus Bathyarchaeota archaeon]|nr:Lrp/AsnC ligand binding domain-containing protein [Candidatus Bathyarchaeota archaeon]MBS7617434.1 Lrp/AsnC ligand binding domain-containing protein [Candidatus Bathyarchaeota archaeon]
MKAYILVNSEPRMIWKVAESALKIEGVKEAYAVTGQFDDIIQVEFEKMEDLGRIIEMVQSIKGVLRTQTLITIPPPVRD